MDLWKEARGRFDETFARARTCGVADATAMSLATVGADGRPSVRTVLLKAADDRGFVFFTNFESRKSAQIRQNPRAALAFYWPPLNEQVTVEGAIELTTEAEADAYWQTRPRESQVGAWASFQSQPLDRRATLEQRFLDFDRKFQGGPVPRPPHWSGYRVVPDRIEFWKAAPHRLHERTVYERQPAGWTKTLLYP